MYWYKVKSVLIILFLCLNIFLISRMGYNAYVKSSREKKNIETIVSVLKSDNIKISKEQIPLKTVKLKKLTVKNVFADEKAFVSSFLGNKYTKNGNVFQNDGSVLKLSDISFTYSNQNALPEIRPDEQAVQNCLSLLSEKGFYVNDIKYTYDSRYIKIRLTPDGQPLFESELVAVMGKSGFVSLSGSWANPTVSNDTVFTLKPASDALIAFYTDPSRPSNNAVIRSITYGYSIWPGGNAPQYKSAEAVPVWRVLLSNGQYFCYDAR